MKITSGSDEELPFCLNVDQVAALLGLNRNKTYEIIHSEGFPSIRTGRRIIIPRNEFMEWLRTEAKKPTKIRCELELEQDRQKQ